ncbi:MULTISPECIES: type II toxin-antitoxin system PemK/MazF family toxin [unclassified Pseudomonas]|jgi:mRNA interferase ChpB|uniref:type II toxin-antitoxin system PemK/MazF family toxin n=1 Tax=unclassified Pseudomonas TaxID=196821 RepID=UPI0007030F0E|nr:MULTISPECIES: type II toxin-antitoxin system PemK/MazF family toxin [unclassified Pseudomonas]KQZ94716.1 growth inhibitor PemK [Pseudomonas sp. Root562]
MVRRQPPKRGDVYWIDPNPVAGREMMNRHRFVVITPSEINSLGVSMTVPITSGGSFSRHVGLAVVISGYETNGVAVCNQVRSFDIEQRVRDGSARFIERLDDATMSDIIARVISAIDPAD